MKVVVFGFDDFGERVASFLHKKDVLVVVLDEEEEIRAKNKMFDVYRIYSIDDDEIKKIEDFDVAVAVLKDEDKNLFLCSCTLSCITR